MVQSYQAGLQIHLLDIPATVACGAYLDCLQLVYNECRLCQDGKAYGPHASDPTSRIPLPPIHPDSTSSPSLGYTKTGRPFTLAATQAACMVPFLVLRGWPVTPANAHQIRSPKPY